MPAGQPVRAALVNQSSENAATLGEELRNIIDHAASLLEAISDEGDPKLNSLRERVSASIDTARVHLEEMQVDTERASERAAAALAQWIGENPWAAVAIGAGAGIAIGLLLAARRSRTPDAAPR
jgi:ElaB/YqjD/DUF883 family membrane-anchored ribosome-binding protein